MKSSPFAQSLLFAALLISLMVAACSRPSTPAPAPAACGLTIVTSLSDGRLTCNKSLGAEHQHQLSTIVLANHAISCDRVGDTIRISGLEFVWESDGDGGWSRKTARCSTQYMNEAPILKDFTPANASSIENILTSDSYCPLGQSCDDPCGCDDQCCEDGDCCLARGLTCGARIATGGVIIAVVSSLPQ
jgi:hypothetical protein